MSLGKEEQLKAAIIDVHAGRLSSRKACKVHDVGQTTLSCHIAGVTTCSLGHTSQQLLTVPQVSILYIPVPDLLTCSFNTAT